MRILLDSHVFVWFVLGARQCRRDIRDLIERDDVTAFVSAATAWEIATKARLGKWQEGEAVVRNLAQIIADHEFTPLPISIEHGRVAGLLPGAHKDPFDRMLVAQSQIDALPLVTADRALRAFGIETIW